MAARSDLQTRIIISAQDRGASMLLRKLGGEADAATDKFAGMRDAFVGAMGGISQGFAVKKAIDWIDDYENTVLSMATTLTDTMRNSGRDIQKVFEQNSRHAESFFRLLQRQANRSYASFDNLKDAYMMFTNVGMALSPTDASARGLGNLVDRIRMATAGQAENIQIIQEMRSLLSGNVRAGSQMAIMFQQRDPEFARRIKGLVAGGSGQAVLDYLNSLLADFDMSGAVSKMFGKARSALMTEIQIASIEAFRPFKDEAASAMREIADSMASEDSPLRQAIGSYADALADMLKLGRSFVREVADNRAVKFLVSNAAPRIIAIGSAASTAALAFGALRLAAVSAMGALHTIPGMLVGGYAALSIGEEWAGRQMSVEKAVKRANETGRGEDYSQVTRSMLANVSDALSSLVSGITSLVGERLAVIGEFFGKLYDVWSSVGAVAMNAYEAGNKIVLIVEEYGEKLYHGLMAAVFNGLADLNSAVMSGLRSTVDAITGAINSIFGTSIGKMPAVGEELSKSLRKKAGNHESFASQSDVTIGELAEQLSKSGKKLADSFGNYAKSVSSAYQAGKGLFAFSGSPYNAMLDEYEKRRKTRESGAAKTPSGAVEAVTQHQSRTDLDKGLQSLAGMGTKGVSERLSRLSRLSSLIGKLSGEPSFKSEYDRNRAILSGRPDISMLSEKAKPLAMKFQTLQNELKSLTDEYKAHQAKNENQEMQETAVRINAVNQSLTDSAERLVSALDEDRARLEQIGLEKNELWLAEQKRENERAELEKAKLDRERAEQAAYENRLQGMRDQGAFGSFAAGAYAYNTENQATESQAWEQVGREVAQSVENSLSDGLYNFFKEGELDLVAMLQSVNDSFMRSMTDMIARSITDMLVQMVVGWVSSEAMLTTSASVASTAMTTLASSAFTASTALASIGASSAGSGISEGLSSSLSAAFPGFATGGVVTSPTLAMIGEGGMNEAVVPLPDGRSVPVVGAGVTVNIIDNSGGDTEKRVEEDRDDEGNTILNVIIDAASRNKRGFRNRMRTSLGIK